MMSHSVNQIQPGVESKIAVTKENVLDLRRQGYTLRTVGEKLGISHERVRQLEKEALKDSLARSSATAAEWRELLTEQLCFMLEKLIPGVEAGKTQAVEKSVMVIDRLCKLWGLDAASGVINYNFNAEVGATSGGLPVDRMARINELLQRAALRRDAERIADGLPPSLTANTVIEGETV